MAHITWLNVPVPDVGNTEQQGFRTAADLLGNAVRSATQGVATVQGVQDAQKAAETQAADRFVMEKMLSTQDPNQYNKMRADGSLLGPAADRASSATLVAAEGRANDLYTLDRTRTRNRELQAAEKLLDVAAPMAVDDPEGALRVMSQAKFTNVEDQIDLDKKVRDLFLPKQREADAGRRDEELNRRAADLADRLVSFGGSNPRGQAQLYQSEADAEVRRRALKFMTDWGEDTKKFHGTNQGMDPLNSIVTESGSLANKIYDGVEDAQYRQFGNNLQMAMKVAGPSNPPPGTPEWTSMNGGRVPSQADMMDWQEKYVKPVSQAERGEDNYTTAIGPYQVVNRTRADIINRFGKQLFGTNDLSKIPYTLENEDKIAAKIYQTQKAGAWQATQDYLGLKDLKAFKGRSWDEAKPLLSYIDGGVAPRSFAREATQIEARLRESELALTEGQKVILNAKVNQSWGLAEATDDLMKFVGKEARPGDIREIVEKTVRQAKEAGTAITHAEAVGLIKNALHDDKAWNTSDLSSDLDLEDSKLVQSAKDLGNARAALKSFERNQDAAKRVQELREEYKKAAAKAESSLAQAKRSPNAGESALVDFKKWQDVSDRLRKLVAPAAPSGVDPSLVGGLAPAGPAPMSPVNTARSIDIDLFLDPQPSSRDQSSSDIQRRLSNIDLLIEEAKKKKQFNKYMSR
jgi:muramidase (phage lysozyme)